MFETVLYITLTTLIENKEKWRHMLVAQAGALGAIENIKEICLSCLNC